MEAVRPHLTEHENLLLSTSLRVSVKSKIHYSKEYRTFATTLYCKSPTVYRFLQARYSGIWISAKSTNWCHSRHFFFFTAGFACPPNLPSTCGSHSRSSRRGAARRSSTYSD